MTVEVLPCCCAVSPCPCFQTTGGYRVTWTGLVRHSPVGCACFFATEVPPNYSGPAFEVYTLRNTFTSGVPSKDFRWRLPTQSQPAPCQLDAIPNATVTYASVAWDFYNVGLGGYCDGPYPLPNLANFQAQFTMIPYRPSVGQKWQVWVQVFPFELKFQSDSTDCDPTGWYLISSGLVNSAGVQPPYSTTCNSNYAGNVSSELIAEGTVSVVRI